MFSNVFGTSPAEILKEEESLTSGLQEVSLRSYKGVEVHGTVRFGRKGSKGLNWLIRRIVDGITCVYADLACGCCCAIPRCVSNYFSDDQGCGGSGNSKYFILCGKCCHPSIVAGHDHLAREACDQGGDVELRHGDCRCICLRVAHLRSPPGACE